MLMMHQQRKKKSGTRKFQITKTLAAYLSVFAKFKNPKGGYKVEECQRLYKELLCHTDPKIQKLAFDCIMTFNYKYLTPYNVDTENKVIAEEHRMDSLAILMSPTSLYDSSFPCWMHISRTKDIFEFVFVPFKDYVNDDTLTAVKKIMENTDPKSIVPIRKQHSALITLDLIFHIWEI
ncbi:small subunit processome component 20 [Caerostris extrusa]|uniref:Small subunit processome component 20 n=1 Tax=Caerostris extrusa TaxID=172846 RepID=A0AAV4MIS1_CAEEX|nr:small subunit processome component 20 [Caerostris extrusa]